MRRSIVVVLFTFLLALAGCNGILASSSETPAGTVTPVDVPTDEPTPTPFPQLAPGLSGKGVVDRFALSGAHAAALDSTSFTYHDETTVRFTNGTIERYTEADVLVASNRSRYNIRLNGSRDKAFSDTTKYSIEQWSNGTRVLMAQRTDGNTSYRVVRRAEKKLVIPDFGSQRIFGFDPSSDNPIYSVFSAVETRVIDKMKRNGTTLYEVAATNVTSPITFTLVDTNDQENISFHALVTSTGLVQEYRYDYTATLNGRPVSESIRGETVTVSRRVRYSHLGDTAIKRPSWYESALENISIHTQVRGTDSQRPSSLTTPQSCTNRDRRSSLCKQTHNDPRDINTSQRTVAKKTNIVSLVVSSQEFVTSSTGVRLSSAWFGR